MIVTDGECFDTSACFLVDFSGIGELSNTAFNVYPNPVTDVVTMDFNTAVSGEVRIYDITMKLVDVIEVSETSTLDYSMNVPSGVYTIEFKTDSSRILRRVVKQ